MSAAAGRAGLPDEVAGSIARVLEEIVQPAGYVQWEYLSRQRLLSFGIARSTAAHAARVLDIGCGYGALALTVAEATGSEVVAMDILRERLTTTDERRRKRDGPSARRVNLAVADAEHGLPFRPQSFDLAVATEVLEHLDEPARMLSEVHRVLRPGGRFLMTTPNAGALPYRFLKLLPKALTKKLAASLTRQHLHPELLGRTPSHPDEHRREGFTLADLVSLGRGSGLRMVRGYTYRIPVPDKILDRTPRALSRRLATLGSRPLPAGLQLYGEFVRQEDAA